MPLSSSLRDATFPKGTAFGGSVKVCDIAQRRPLEGRLPPLRGKMSRSDKRGNLPSECEAEGVATQKTSAEADVFAWCIIFKAFRTACR